MRDTALIYVYTNTKKTHLSGSLVRRSLLSEQNLAASAKVLSSLGGSLVGTGLQTDDGLTSVQHIFAELALALVGWLGAQVGELEVGVLPGLKRGFKKIYISNFVLGMV